MNSRNPSCEGTRITTRAPQSKNIFKAIAAKKRITIVDVAAPRMLLAHGFLRSIFEAFDRHKVAVDVVSTSEVSVSLTVDSNQAIPALAADLAKLADVKYEGRKAIVCLVGENLRDTPGIAALVFRELADKKIRMISQGASEINLTFVIEEDEVPDVIQRLHKTFFAELDPKSSRGSSPTLTRESWGLLTSAAHRLRLTAAGQRTSDTSAAPPANLPSKRCLRDPTAAPVSTALPQTLPPAASSRKPPGRRPVPRPSEARPQKQSEPLSIAFEAPPARYSGNSGADSVRPSTLAWRDHGLRYSLSAALRLARPRTSLTGRLSLRQIGSCDFFVLRIPVDLSSTVSPSLCSLSLQLTFLEQFLKQHAVVHHRLP